MNRRDMIRNLSIGSAALAVSGPTGIIAATVVGVTRTPKPAPMPTLPAGSLLTATYFADLVDRVNKLTEITP